MKIPARRSFVATVAGVVLAAVSAEVARRGAIMQTGDYIFLTGQGASPEGDRPFIDRLNLKTFETERLFRSDAKSYETVIAPLDDDGKMILTRYETQSDAPNYYVRDLCDQCATRGN